MKILSLKANNINSLKGKTTIDFESLTKDSALFAITGSTGSGKSTILDIISCALYGQTPRLKTPSELISRNTAEAYCEVEFEVKSKRYRSSWKQHRARKSPTGALQNATMELVDLAQDKILSQKSLEVPKLVEEISGLDFERFTKSMLLAQGGFDAFLKANEKERSDILEKITGTQIYADISMAVFEKHKLFLEDLQKEKEKLDSIDLLTQEQLQEKEQQLQDVAVKKQQKDRELQKVLESLNYLAQLKEVQQNYEKYKELFFEAKQKKEDNKELFIQLDLANRALNVWSSFEALKQKKQLQKETQLEYKKLQQDLEYIKNHIVKEQENYEKIKKEFEKQTEIFQVQTKKLKECFSLEVQQQLKQKQYKELTQTLQTKQKELQALHDETKELEKKDTFVYQKLKSSLDDLEKQYALMQQSELNNPKIESKIQKEYQKVQEVLKEYELYVEVLCKEKLEQKEYQQTQHLLQNQQKTQEYLEGYIQTLKEKKIQEDLFKKYEEDRAKLKKGKPCFVCGSTLHPFVDKGVVIEIESSSKTLLEQKEEELKELFTLMATNKTKNQHTLEALQTLEQQKATSLEVFKKYSWDGKDPQPFYEQKEVLEQQQNSLEDFRVQKEQLLKQKDELYKDLQKEKQAQEKLALAKMQNKTKLQAIQEEIVVLKQQIQTLQVELEQLSQQRVSLLNVIDLKSYETELHKEYKQLQDKKQTLETIVQKLLTKQEQQEQQHKQLQQTLEILQTEVTKLQNTLEELLKQNGFENEQELLKAKLSNEQKETLQKECETLERNFRELQILYEQSKKTLETLKTEPKTTKQFQELELQKETLAKEIEHLSQNIGSLKTELVLNNKNMQKSQKQIELVSQKEQQLRVWTKLDELIGSAKGDKFKKFVQAITLEHLIYLANQHLEVINQRYRLTKLERGKKQEIYLGVIDLYQGDVVRGVNTLSGGESFIVSLALALGLSDLSSQKIAIDSLFLDEGFGTLDTQSLEMALNALNLLQSRGKMVGVISHVEALKERIPLQIKVIQRGEGVSVVEVQRSL